MWTMFKEDSKYESVANHIYASRIPAAHVDATKQTTTTASDVCGFKSWIQNRSRAHLQHGNSSTDKQIS